MIRNFSNEISRKLIHISSLLIPLGYIFIIKDKKPMVILLIILTLISLLIEYARSNKSSSIGYFFHKHLNSILRPNEKKGYLTGATWMLIGFTISVLIFDAEIAALSLLFLSIGDSIAGLVGRFFPIGKIWNKSIFGSISGFFSCIIFGYAVSNSLPFQIIFFGAISGMLIELLPLKLDDNLSIPVFSGSIMQILQDIL